MNISPIYYNCPVNFNARSHSHSIGIYSTFNGISYVSIIRKYMIFHKYMICQYFNPDTRENIYIKIKISGVNKGMSYFVKWKSRRAEYTSKWFPSVLADSLKTNLPECEIRKNFPSYKGSYSFENYQNIEISGKYQMAPKFFYKNVFFKIISSNAKTSESTNVEQYSNSLISILYGSE
jgi:hypothetical protein